MKKTFFLLILIIFSFSGCFSFLNFWETKKSEISISSDSPDWVNNPQVKGYITQLGIAKNIKSDDYNFYREIALINGKQNLIKKIYSKTKIILNEYSKNEKNSAIFEKDINYIAKQVALRSVDGIKVVNSFKSRDDILFLHLVLNPNNVLSNIVTESKKFFKVNKLFIQYFSDEKSKQEIINILEN
jgi:hypothetical protein